MDATAANFTSIQTILQDGDVGMREGEVPYNVSQGNGSVQGDEKEAMLTSQAHLLTTSIILGLMILATIIGNVFVIAAIILEKNLQVRLVLSQCNL